MLTINMNFIKGILFVRLKGILDGDTSIMLNNKLYNMVTENGVKYILLNLDDVTYVDKYGVDVIIKNYIEVNQNKGKFIIVGINKLFLNDRKCIANNLYQINNESKVFDLVNL